MPRGMLGDELARRARRLRSDLGVLLTSGYALVQRMGADTPDFSPWRPAGGRA
jgi:hypothetical protein